jgi:hypothetical protein
MRAMKNSNKQSLIRILAATLLLTACSSDKDSNDPKAEQALTEQPEDNNGITNKPDKKTLIKRAKNNPALAARLLPKLSTEQITQLFTGGTDQVQDKVIEHLNPKASSEDSNDNQVATAFIAQIEVDAAADLFKGDKANTELKQAIVDRAKEESTLTAELLKQTDPALTSAQIAELYASSDVQEKVTEYLTTLGKEAAKHWNEASLQAPLLAQAKTNPDLAAELLKKTDPALTSAQIAELYASSDVQEKVTKYLTTLGKEAAKHWNEASLQAPLLAQAKTNPDLAAELLKKTDPALTSAQIAELYASSDVQEKVTKYLTTLGKEAAKHWNEASLQAPLFAQAKTNPNLAAELLKKTDPALTSAQIAELYASSDVQEKVTEYLTTLGKEAAKHWNEASLQAPLLAQAKTNPDLAAELLKKTDPALTSAQIAELYASSDVQEKVTKYLTTLGKEAAKHWNEASLQAPLLAQAKTNPDLAAELLKKTDPALTSAQIAELYASSDVQEKVTKYLTTLGKEAAKHWNEASLQAPLLAQAKTNPNLAAELLKKTDPALTSAQIAELYASSDVQEKVTKYLTTLGKEAAKHWNEASLQAPLLAQAKTNPNLAAELLKKTDPALTSAQIAELYASSDVQEKVTKYLTTLGKEAAKHWNEASLQAPLFAQAKTNPNLAAELLKKTDPALTSAQIAELYASSDVQEKVTKYLTTLGKEAAKHWNEASLQAPLLAQAKTNPNLAAELLKKTDPAFTSAQIAELYASSDVQEKVTKYLTTLGKEAAKHWNEASLQAPLLAQAKTNPDLAAELLKKTDPALTSAQIAELYASSDVQEKVTEYLTTLGKEAAKHWNEASLQAPLFAQAKTNPNLAAELLKKTDPALTSAQIAELYASSDVQEKVTKYLTTLGKEAAKHWNEASLQAPLLAQAKTNPDLAAELLKKTDPALTSAQIAELYASSDVQEKVTKYLTTLGKEAAKHWNEASLQAPLFAQAKTNPNLAAELLKKTDPALTSAQIAELYASSDVQEKVTEYLTTLGKEAAKHWNEASLQAPLLAQAKTNPDLAAELLKKTDPALTSAQIAELYASSDVQEKVTKYLTTLGKEAAKHWNEASLQAPLFAQAKTNPNLAAELLKKTDPALTSAQIAELYASSDVQEKVTEYLTTLGKEAAKHWNEASLQAPLLAQAKTNPDLAAELLKKTDPALTSAQIAELYASSDVQEKVTEYLTGLDAEKAADHWSDTRLQAPLFAQAKTNPDLAAELLKKTDPTLTSAQIAELYASSDVQEKVTEYLTTLGKEAAKHWNEASLQAPLLAQAKTNPDLAAELLKKTDPAFTSAQIAELYASSDVQEKVTKYLTTLGKEAAKHWNEASLQAPLLAQAKTNPNLAAELLKKTDPALTSAQIAELYASSDVQEKVTKYLTTLGKEAAKHWNEASLQAPLLAQAKTNPDLAAELLKKTDPALTSAQIAELYASSDVQEKVTEYLTTLGKEAAKHWNEASLQAPLLAQAKTNPNLAAELLKKTDPALTSAQIAELYASSDVQEKVTEYLTGLDAEKAADHWSDTRLQAPLLAQAKTNPDLAAELLKKTDPALTSAQIAELYASSDVQEKVTEYLTGLNAETAATHWDNQHPELQALLLQLAAEKPELTAAILEKNTLNTELRFKLEHSDEALEVAQDLDAAYALIQCSSRSLGFLEAALVSNQCSEDELSTINKAIRTSTPFEQLTLQDSLKLVALIQEIHIKTLTATIDNEPGTDLLSSLIGIDLQTFDRKGQTYSLPTFQIKANNSTSKRQKQALQLLAYFDLLDISIRQKDTSKASKRVNFFPFKYLTHKNSGLLTISLFESLNNLELTVARKDINCRINSGKCLTEEINKIGFFYDEGQDYSEIPLQGEDINQVLLSLFNEKLKDVTKQDYFSLMKFSWNNFDINSNPASNERFKLRDVKIIHFALRNGFYEIIKFKENGDTVNLLEETILSNEENYIAQKIFYDACYSGLTENYCKFIFVGDSSTDTVQHNQPARKVGN